jgi:tRNA(adenine34) deaminase
MKGAKGNMWKDIEKPWQQAFEMAWEAYKRGTIPIGCIIVTPKGEIVSKGRNRIFDSKSDNPLARSNMAHAEMTAMLGLREIEHPDIKNYILYTTMEPCPMCFGTMVMMSIRNIRFGARDGFAGATSLNDKLDYIKGKEIDIKRGTAEIEAFQLILQSAYEYYRQHPRIESILETWRAVNELSVDYGKRLNELKYFERAVEENKSIDNVYDEVIEGYLELNLSQTIETL